MTTRATSATEPFAAAVPTWARTLITSVCRQYRVRLPEKVSWTASRRSASGGMTNPRRTATRVVTVPMRFTMGADPRDQKHVVLHELAHYIHDGSDEFRSTFAAGTGAKKLYWSGGRLVRSTHEPAHGAAFYKRAIPLFLGHGSFSLADAIAREVLVYPSNATDIVEALSALGRKADAQLVYAAQGELHRRRSAPPKIVVPKHPIVPIPKGKVHVCSGCGHRVGARTVSLYEYYRKRGREKELTHTIEDTHLSLDFAKS